MHTHTSPWIPLLVLLNLKWWVRMVVPWQLSQVKEGVVALCWRCWRTLSSESFLASFSLKEAYCAIFFKKKNPCLLSLIMIKYVAALGDNHRLYSFVIISVVLKIDKESYKKIPPIWLRRMLMKSWPLPRISDCLSAEGSHFTLIWQLWFMAAPPPSFFFWAGGCLWNSKSGW